MGGGEVCRNPKRIDGAVYIEGALRAGFDVEPFDEA